MLYQSLLERGLSIGIGVSSPGFQLRSVLSAEEEEEVEEEMRRRGWWGGAGNGRGRGRRILTAPEQRRTLSEADIGNTLANRAAEGLGDGLGGEHMIRAVTEGEGDGGGARTSARGRRWLGGLGIVRDARKAGGAGKRRTSPLGRDGAVFSGDEGEGEGDLEEQSVLDEAEGEDEDEDEEQRTAPSSAWYLGGGGGGGGGQQQQQQPQQHTTAYSRMGATLDLSALSARLGELGQGARKKGWSLLGRASAGGRGEEAVDDDETESPQRVGESQEEVTEGRRWLRRAERRAR